jgi:hypothetical protein
MIGMISLVMMCSRLAHANRQADVQSFQQKLEVQKKIPDEFAFSSPKFIVTKGSDQSTFGDHVSKKGISTLGKDLLRTLPAGEEKKEHKYAFVYPTATYENGVWLFSRVLGNGSDEVVIHRPVTGLGKDETFSKSWDSKKSEAKTAKGEPFELEELCTGDDKWAGSKGKGMPVEEFEDVQDYCWTPYCLMVEKEPLMGCFIYKMKDGSYRSYSWKATHETPTSDEAPSGNEATQKSKSIGCETWSLALLLSCLWSMAHL